MNKLINHKEDLEIVSCDYCNSEEYSMILKGKDWYNNIKGLFTVVKCDNCGLVFTNPRPTKESIHKFYPDNAGYYIPQKPNFDSFKDKLKFTVLQEYFNYPKGGSFIKKIVLLPLYLYLYRTLKKEMIPNYIKNGKLLDIGCSYGNYLYKMRHYGWTVKGLEMNKKAAEFGKKGLELNIENTDLEGFQTEEKFDVIVLSMVLEHVLSPTKTLAKVSTLLKKGGTLIISIPNFEGYEAQKYKEYAYTLQVPTHITHFTSSTIQCYLRENNFENIKFYFQKTTRDLVAPLTYMEKDNQDIGFNKLLRIPFIRKTFIQQFINILSLLGKTSRMTIWSKKK